MSKPDVNDQLVELFRTAENAHGDAFRDTGGVHPDWPIWYADYLFDGIRELTKAKFTRSELIAFLVDIDKEHRQKAPKTDWPPYYAAAFLQKFKA